MNATVKEADSKRHKERSVTNAVLVLKSELCLFIEKYSEYSGYV